MLAKSPRRPSTPEAPTASLPSPPLRLLPGGANSSRAGLSPAVNQRLSRRTHYRDLWPTTWVRASLLRPKWKSLGRGVGICEGVRESRLFASFRRFRRAASIAQCSPTAGFRMLSSMWLRMALRAATIRSANLLRSVSRAAASYKDFQSELEPAPCMVVLI